jgi:hypothetical protein
MGKDSEALGECGTVGIGIISISPEKTPETLPQNQSNDLSLPGTIQFIWGSPCCPPSLFVNTHPLYI